MTETQSPASTTARTPAAVSPSAAFNDPSAMAMGAGSQEAIQEMLSMGFERAQIDRAMRAAFYNPDRAVEYLMTVSVKEKEFFISFKMGRESAKLSFVLRVSPKISNKVSQGPELKLLGHLLLQLQVQPLLPLQPPRSIPILAIQ